ncbi:hypothetical protein U0070_018417 [Myodes glareolus]|uniref:Deoxynucleoside kinase domain-containing protein n=1 Tax=Myodes glareolus TaxID=447135 RepID=A0AAW0JWW2_MYOGA
MATPPKRFCPSPSASSEGTRIKKISIEGNIAAGKSTFVNILKQVCEDWEVELTTSQKSGGNVLQMMYEKPERWSFTFQSYACLSRIRAQLASLNGKLKDAEKPVLFFERSVYSDRTNFDYLQEVPILTLDVNEDFKDKHESLVEKVCLEKA